MKFVLAIESDLLSQNNIFEALKFVDPQAQVRFFTSLEAFYIWLKEVQTEGAAALAHAGVRAQGDPSPSPESSADDQISLLIVSHEIFNCQKFHLIKKAHSFFSRNSLIRSDAPAGIIVTAFDNPHEDLRSLRDPLLKNIIYKPFDKLILRQHLEYALKPDTHFTPSAIASIDASAEVDLLKKVPLAEISEIGFSLPLPKKMEIGETHKFFHPLFETKNQNHLWARLVDHDPATQVGVFQHFAASANQIKKIHAHVAEHEHTNATVKKVPDKKIKVLILDSGPPQGLEILNDLMVNFPEGQLAHYSHFAQAMLDLDDKDSPKRKTLPEFFTVVLINIDLLEGDGAKRKELIIKTLEERAKRYAREDKAQPTIYLFGNPRSTTQTPESWRDYAQDFFLAPIDKNYALKKIFTHLNYSGTKTYEILSKRTQENILLSELVKVQKISEAGVSIQSPEKIKIGEFREIVFESKADNTQHILLGQVHFVREDNISKAYVADLVFYGVTDAVLKQVRLWLLKTYIDSKDGAA